MSTPMPLVLIFGIITVLLVRSRDMRPWEASMAALFGFYLALTPMGWAVIATVNWLLGGFLHH
ncbi:hypothetical protein QMK19_15140 [Streptomyces sp. H10-C2]|uniref:hypothetical protein n=1 Tax=unclassified Streptomyces TaxID=2593676 RepID=UPI0024BA47F0|nr:MULTISPECIES: hypothetical protein [unclassified Streptomyces]MDJ0341389.1 hypothetical protein [Streptomyces sp. PH10-H1]MDJ0370984.1 hypothetical protein [Streptomyces sp. H10-C2]